MKTNEKRVIKFLVLILCILICILSVNYQCEVCYKINTATSKFSEIKKNNIEKESIKEEKIKEEKPKKRLTTSEKMLEMKDKMNFEEAKEEKLFTISR